MTRSADCCGRLVVGDDHELRARGAARTGRTRPVSACNRPGLRARAYRPLTSRRAEGTSLAVAETWTSRKRSPWRARTRVAGLPIRRDHRGERTGDAVAGEQVGDEADAMHVDVPVGPREPELLAEAPRAARRRRAPRSAGAAFAQPLGSTSSRDGRLPCARESRHPYDGGHGASPARGREEGPVTSKLSLVNR